ncbi:type I-E CRISPR-associated protein Cas6/Cse3/CasE [Streptomyces sp. C11-1]|uniref:Type I-E CRISPR-associated protein Cas6/Cse3/CasE n=1 Tax=Streptomyces durocortorensis TaxID=2811104 RepID=A0ABY9W4K6_9ACTN|nr:type I-E CRISPR-associated protein Cas6/Cse3/CasE [Streptomyces durocortorensis]WNF31074.1 type I-E CRISPR-associated protein Cas6/Cse3/CasE [Streptomyces durocortorensis]
MGEQGPGPVLAEGLLFRTESGPDPTLLVQTAHIPDLTALPADYGTARTVDLTPLLNSLTPGRTVRYRITAARSAGNPNRRPVTGKRRGKITHLTGDDAITWWQTRTQTVGLQPVTVSGLPRPFPRTRVNRTSPHFTLHLHDALEENPKLTLDKDLVRWVLSRIDPTTCHTPQRN